MSGKIRVLLVDDSYQVRQSVKSMLDLFESGEFVVVGEAENGQEAVELTKKLHPDVVLMDVNMPVMDGIAATARIMQECPTGVVIVSVQGEQDYLRRAMKAGARDYLVKPFTHDELVASLRTAGAAPVNAALPAAAPAPAPKPQGKVITVFSTKGGVGKTTVAANLAGALAKDGKVKVAAVDLDLEFGSLATMMGVRPQATIVDLCRLTAPITAEHVGRVLARQHQSAVGVLAAPPLPHLAPEVDGPGRADTNRNYVEEILQALRATHEFVVIDTPASFREANLIAFDQSDLILLVTQPEITALESTAKGLDVLLERLEYPREKVQVVLNRSDSLAGLNLDDIAEALGVPLSHQVPGDSTAAVVAANTGIPVVLKRAKNSPMIDGLVKLAARVSGEEPEPAHDAADRAAEHGKSVKAARPLAPARRLFGLL